MSDMIIEINKLKNNQNPDGVKLLAVNNSVFIPERKINGIEINIFNMNPISYVTPLGFWVVGCFSISIIILSTIYSMLAARIHLKTISKFTFKSTIK